jgi:hypothetical protein
MSSIYKTNNFYINSSGDDHGFNESRRPGRGPENNRSLRIRLLNGRSVIVVQLRGDSPIAIHSSITTFYTANPLPAQHRLLAVFRVVRAEHLETMNVAAVGAAILRQQPNRNGFYCYEGNCPMSVPSMVAGEEVVRISLDLFLIRRNERGFEVPVRSRRHVYVTPSFILPPPPQDVSH